MILDEATSALDNKTAYNIENIIFELKNVTAIVITHKLVKELLYIYDCIILQKCKITERKNDINYINECTIIKETRKEELKC